MNVDNPVALRNDINNKLKDPSGKYKNPATLKKHANLGGVSPRWEVQVRGEALTGLHDFLIESGNVKGYRPKEKAEETAEPIAPEVVDAEAAAETDTAQNMTQLAAAIIFFFGSVVAFAMLGYRCRNPKAHD